MLTIVTVEIVSAVYLTILFIGQIIESGRSRSSRYLNLCILLVLFSMIVDAMAYSFTDASTPFAFRYTVCLLAYASEGIYFFGFSYYSEEVIAEKTQVDPRLFRILRIAEGIWLAATAALFIAGKIIVYENGIEAADYGYPLYLSVYQIAVMLYTPAIALAYRKKIGREAVILLSVFNITPILGILSAIITNYDYSYVLAAVTIVFIAELLQRRQVQVQKAELAMHEGLARSNRRILALTDDFESLYDVELESGRYISYVKGDFYQSNIYDKLVSPSEFFEDLRANIDTVVVPEDRDKLFSILNRETILRKLSGHEHFDYYYRVITERGPIWLKLRIVYKDADRKNVIIGVFNAEGDVAAKLISDKNRQLEERQKQLEEVNNSLKEANHRNELLLDKEREQQKRLENALDAAQIASKAKTEFLFNMSHDIRTPMNAILGYTDIAMNHVHEPDRVGDSLKKIKRSGGHLLSLINDILEMSRIEAGRLEIVNAPLNAYEVTEGVVNMSQALAATKDIHFTAEIEEMKNPYVYADELHTNQIVINLISNAIKYTMPGGAVDYRIGQVTDPEDGIAVYRITVRDNGIGISEEFQAHLFESFAREQSAGVSREEGAGLGLAIVKRILDLIGGTISVRSRVGEGSVFTVELPLRVMDESAIERFRAGRSEEAEACGDTAFDGRRILLVEDNEMNREIAAELLQEKGMTVEEAGNGAAAVELLRTKGPDYYDFILMDIQMPVMNGYEATRAIRTMYPGIRLPIIALSANAFEEDRAASVAAGMDAHLAKPISTKELFGTLVKYI